MKEILREVGMIARCLATISDIEFKEINLSKGQYLYLVRIYENPGIIQEKVASMLKVDRTTTAKAVKKLVQEGLIEKIKSPENKKEWKLYCTAKGKEIYPFLEKEELYSTETALAGMSEDEKQEAYELLNKIRINIEKDWLEMKKGTKRGY